MNKKSIKQLEAIMMKWNKNKKQSHIINYFKLLKVRLTSLNKILILIII